MKSRLKKIAEETKSSIEEMVTSNQGEGSQFPTPSPNLINPIQTQINQISDKGRSILKEIEEYKFFVEQMARAMKNNQPLAQMISDKKSDIDEASQKIYDIVFQMENMDVMKMNQNPMMGTPNDNQETEERQLDEEKEQETKEDESIEEEKQEKNKPSNTVNSPNDLIDSDGKDPLVDDDVEDERNTKEDFDEDEVEKDEKLPPNPKDLLPKQPTVQPQGKP